MRSPFPGMNPYLEAPDAWEDFHNALIQRIRAVLLPVLPGGYFVKSERLVFLLEPPAEERGMASKRRPDTFVGGGPATGPAAVQTIATVPATHNTTFILPGVVEEKHPYLEVRRKTADRRLGDLVSVIELLSPSNKTGGGRSEYLAKREQLLRDGVNVLEIDLLRGGGPVSMEPPPPGDYRVALARPERRPRVEVWSWFLRDAIPPVPVPLRPIDGDATLDLQAALHAAHDQGGFAAWVYADGTGPIDPPLSAEDAAWAEAKASGPSS